MTTTTTSRKSTDNLQQNRLNSNDFCMDDAKVSLVRRAVFCCIPFHFILFSFVFFFSHFPSTVPIYIHFDVCLCIHTRTCTVYIVESCIADVSKCKHSMAIRERTASLTVRSRITYHIVIDKRATQTTKGGLQNTTANTMKRRKRRRGWNEDRWIGLKGKTKQRLRNQTNAAVLSICERNIMQTILLLFFLAFFSFILIFCWKKKNKNK